MSTQSTGHGGTKKYGRNKVKCASYRSSMRREHNKIKRVNRSSGNFAALKWAEQYAPPLMDYARRMCK